MSGKTKQIVKFVYAGRAGPLSVRPLEELLEAGFRPQAVLVPAPSTGARRLNLLPVEPRRVPDSLATLALEAGLPLLQWQRGRDDAVLQQLTEIGPQMVMSSCFPWRVPANVLALPTEGWWNLHPSILPAWRGPAPLFWQLRAAEAHTGISLHRMASDFDTGPIISQCEMALPLATGYELESILGAEGGQLAIQALRDYVTGELTYRQQDHGQMSYQSLPDQADLIIQPHGAAADAHRFILGSYAAYRLQVQVGDKTFRVKKPVASYAKVVLSDAWRRQGDRIQVRFVQGVLEFMTGEDEWQ